MTKAELQQRSTNFARNLRESLGERHNLRFEIIEGNSVIGGGAAPMVQPTTTLLALRHEKFPAAKLEELLRHSKPPVIARILEDRVLIDLRTVSEDEEIELLNVLFQIS
jgi:L-seryl-tRNA(Ser) seleniumtransferase